MLTPRAAVVALLSVLAMPAAAADVPAYNVEPGCRAAAARSGPNADPQICISKELEAREQIKKDWTSFAASDRATCVPLSSTGGTPTYTELLTCLEMTRDARNIPDDGTRSTTGQRGAVDDESGRRPGRR